MDTVLEQYEGLIKSIVGKYCFNYSYDDLYQAGVVGLMKALKKFDMTRESSFLDYAYFYIKGEVLKELNKSHVIKISDELLKVKREVNDAYNSLLQTFGRNPTEEEISYMIGVDVETVSKVRNLSLDSYSLDEEKEETKNLYNKLEKIEMGYDAGILDLKEALLGLEENERIIIASRYYQDMTQTETANYLGMSQVQVSRQEKKILQKLKNDLTVHTTSL